MFFIAPPGFSKSLFLRRILGDSDEKEKNEQKYTGVGERIRSDNEKDKYYMLSKADVPTSMESAMNEASYVGTIREDGHNQEVVYGAAYEHRKSILGIDEFSVLSDTMQQSYGKTLDEALLTSLDSGYLKKRLRSGKINYITHLTLWSNSQPMRFDISSGIGRRFFFIYFIPTEDEEEKIKKAARKDEKSYPEQELLNDIGTDIEVIKTNLSKINSITIDDEIYDIFDSTIIPHHEENLFKRFAIGHFLATNADIDRDVNVTMENDMEKYLLEAIRWRNEIRRGPDVTQVLKILDDKGMMKVGDLKDKLTTFGLSYKQATKAIRELIRDNVIEKKTTTSPNGKNITRIKKTEIA